MTARAQRGAGAAEAARVAGAGEVVADLVDDLFVCGTCGQLVFLDNDACLHCGSALGYRPSTGQVEVVGDADQRCSMHALIGCTWLVEDPAATPDGRCRSCRLTTVTPPKDDPELVAEWADAERAKRRLVHQCLGLGIPVETITFELMAGQVSPVTIGHAAGVVTIDVDEADDAHRIALRESLDEPYRTMLGHFRHESGHAMWQALVGDGGDDAVARFRELFGDETTDYQAAIDQHYEHGPPDGWELDHVSAYATMHPHEDWAESFAHYLHIRSALGTAEQAGIDTGTLFRGWRGDDDGPLAAPLPEGGSASPAIDDLVQRWLPLTFALNAINRAMGQGDLYPFVLGATVVEKIAFVHTRVEATSPR